MWTREKYLGRSSSVILLRLLLVIVVLAAMTTDDGQARRLVTLNKVRGRWSPSSVPSKKQNSLSRNATRTKVTTGQPSAKVTVGQRRSQGGYGYGGGGGGGSGNYLYQNGGHLMYFSNFDTALTTLAFLSFGVFLLNLLLNFFDLGGSNGLDNKKRTMDRRSIDLHPLTPVHWVLASALVHQMTTEMTNEEDSGECNLSALCEVKLTTPVRGHLKSVMSSLVRLSSTGNGVKSGNHTIIKTEMQKMAAILENGDCERMRKSCLATILASSSARHS